MQKPKKIERKKIGPKEQKKAQEKKTPNASGNIERYVDGALKYCGAGTNDKYHHFLNGANIYLSDFAYDIADGAEPGELEENLTEKAVFDAIKNNKRFNGEIENLIKKMTVELVSGTAKAKQNQIRQQKLMEKRNKDAEKRRKADEARKKKLEVVAKQKAEKIKKDNAQKLIFNEGLTDAQKKAFKKFYGVDVAKQNAPTPTKQWQPPAYYDNYDY